MSRLCLVIGALWAFGYGSEADVLSSLEKFVNQCIGSCQTKTYNKTDKHQKLQIKTINQDTSLDCLEECPNPAQSQSTAPKNSNPPESKKILSQKTQSKDSKKSKNTSLSRPQKQDSWINSIGLIMVSFDDGSFKSGFGILLPDKMFLTSSELAYGVNTYPKHTLLKIRDESSGHFICVAQLHLNLLDRAQGLAIFKVSDYTDDHCNIRAQSYYHKYLLENNAFNLTKVRPQSQQAYFYTVTPSFSDINILQIDGKKHLPTNQAIFGRPFFSKNGDFLGITTITNSTKPTIVSHKEVKKFICSMPQARLKSPPSVVQLCSTSL